MKKILLLAFALALPWDAWGAIGLLDPSWTLEQKWKQCVTYGDPKKRPDEWKKECAAVQREKVDQMLGRVPQ